MTSPARPRCDCGLDLKRSPGRPELVCYVHMPPLRQEWRRYPARTRRLVRQRPSHVPLLVAVETWTDETGQMGLVEA